MLNELYTAQGESLDGVPWEIYPRPQLRRNSYINLNGIWELSVDSQAEPLPIRVPFCPESLLSGINRHFPEGSVLSYKRSFCLPKHFNKGRVLLHIGAADQISEVFVNQKKIGRHEGGYTSFTLDITDALEEENLLEIRCIDDFNKNRL